MEWYRGSLVRIVWKAATALSDSLSYMKRDKNHSEKEGGESKKKRENKISLQKVHIYIYIKIDIKAKSS